MLARIVSGEVVETRDLLIDDVPQHKREMWRPIVDDKPSVNNVTHVLSGPEIIVDVNQVIRRWTATPRALIDVKNAVKAEARRRILERYPEWKQTNMVARGVELQNIWRLTGSWSEEEESEASALQSAWDWIKLVRNASNEIESMDPIPGDFASDARWPT